MRRPQNVKVQSERSTSKVTFDYIQKQCLTADTAFWMHSNLLKVKTDDEVSYVGMLLLVFFSFFAVCQAMSKSMGA